MAETDPKAEENNEDGEKKKLSLSTPVLIAIAGGLLVVIIALVAALFFFRSPDTPPPEDEIAIEQPENIADGQDVEAPPQDSEQQQVEGNNMPPVQDEAKQSDTEDVQAPPVIMSSTSATNTVIASATSQIPTQTQALSTASPSLPDAGNTPPPADSPLSNAEQIAAGFIAMQQQLSALQEENENLTKQVLELKADLEYKDDIIHRRQVMKNLTDARSKQTFEPKLDIKLEPKWGNSEQR